MPARTTTTDRSRNVIIGRLVPRRARSASALGLALAGACLALSFGAPAATAQFAVTSFDGETTDVAGTPLTQAGAHADARVDVDFTSRTSAQGGTVPDDNVRSIAVELPPGLVGNPQSAPTCPSERLAFSPLGGSYTSSCPNGSIVGLADVLQPTNPYGTLVIPIANLDPPPGVAAQLGFNVFGSITRINVYSRAGGRKLVTEAAVPASLPIIGMKMTLWGVPADPRHDALRGGTLLPLCGDGGVAPCPANVPQRPFMSNPTNCAAGPLTTRARASSWQRPDDVIETSFLSHLPDGTLTGVTGCDLLPFEPTLRAAPTEHAADAPTGLSVDLELPQSENPSGVATAHLRKAVVTLPEGMTINPASADGLAACSDAELALTDDVPMRCPEAAKIGTANATTPLLEEPLSGGIYLLSQRSSDPESGEMFRVAVVLENAERGVSVRLAGSIRADRGSGRLVTTFDDNPQMPVERMHLEFKGGSRAPLLNPPTCGPKTVESQLTSWSGKTVLMTNSFDVACRAGLGGFAPSFVSGTADPVAGAFSPLTLTIAKAAGERDLTGLRLELPAGLLAVLKGNLGTQVGTVQAYAGPGSTPFALPGSVFLEGRYGDAPFSLRVVVPAKAGPFDLGTVEVRQRVYVDPRDAHVTVVSDPLPTIVAGVPVRLQRLDVAIDKPRFTFNPTSCSPKWVAATLTSATGGTHRSGSRFQVGECAALALAPVVQVQGGGKGNTARFKHPSLKVSIKQSSGQAHLDKANVVLPKAFNVDLNAPSLKAACPREVYAQDKCSQVARVGTVKAVTPVFAEPLTGPAFLLQKKGQLPDIVMRLQNVHYKIDLIGVLDFLGDGRVITRVKGIPDAPITSFELQIKGGKDGSLLTRSDLCAKKAATQATFKGQNGRLAVKTPTTRIVGCAKAAAKPSRTTSRAVHQRAIGGRS